MPPHVWKAQERKVSLARDNEWKVNNFHAQNSAYAARWKEDNGKNVHS